MSVKYSRREIARSVLPSRRQGLGSEMYQLPVCHDNNLSNRPRMRYAWDIAHLVDPVGVQDAQSAAATAHTLLSHVAQVTGSLQLGDTLVHGLTVDDTL